MMKNVEELTGEKAGYEDKQTKKRYWKSFEQWGNDPEFQKAVEQEFQSSPLREEELTNADKDKGWARREFLKLMGASLAMTTTACIRRPVQKIIPYNKAVEEVTFGTPSFYTSSYFDGSEALGLLVRTREGRPIKIDGNPKYPLNQGATSVRAQAVILSLYDPERIRRPRKNIFNAASGGNKSTDINWADADSDVVKALLKGGAVVLTGTLNSPSGRSVVNEFIQGFKARHIQYEPLSYEEMREGQMASYGEAIIPFYNFDKAKLIISVDADFLGTWIAPTTFTRQFSQGRKDPSLSMNRLVSFDSNYSLTGANADLRIKIKPSQQLDVVMGIAYELIVKRGLSKYAGSESVRNVLSGFSGVGTKLGIADQLSGLADDLWKNKGQSLVVAGGLITQTETAKGLQIAANLLNSALENEGETIDVRGFRGFNGSPKAMYGLVEDMKNGKVKTLIIHGVNPVYSLPESLGFQEAIKKVDLVIYTGDRVDETGKGAHYILPDDHPMESWGDMEALEGMFTIQQPTIRPMYDTRGFQQSLIIWSKQAKVASRRMTSSESYYDYIRQVWKDEILLKQNFEVLWDQALQTGVVEVEIKGKTPKVRNFRIESLEGLKSSSRSGYELALYPTVNLGDGRWANISWLQELPDPITKICWDNYAMISMATAEKLRLKKGSLIEIILAGRKVKIPVHIQPGLHNEVVAVAVGYGRTGAGKVANSVGINSFNLVRFEQGQAIASGQSVEIAVVDGEKYELASTSGNATMEGRKIVAEATLGEYLKDKGAHNHRHKTFSIWGGHQYNGNKWGMAVDLNVCTGCSACIVACQAENNIPVVGKKYVLQGREMHWLRVDRYFSGSPENAEAVFQPVMCQHCDNAPCETVCPVLATVHSSDGLNDMAYNRCVGTRYCANNCPYKVRRFNWFNFTGPVEKPLNMQYNPDVTVRPRGVMEKCSFCVHRIKAARGKSRLENRELKDHDIKVACEQACSAGAIIFGDLNDPESRVARIFKEEQRAYPLLEEFNAAPSVRYLTKIRNKGGGRS